MTTTEFGMSCHRLGVDRGRIQVAVEISEWVTHHPTILTSPDANNLAKDLITKCQQIIRTIPTEEE